MVLYRKLNFPHTLVQHSGKQLSNTELTKRIKALHAELKSLEQESTDVSSLSAIAQDLISPSLTDHKDKNIRSIVACCLADILRIHAPDAPYSLDQTKKILALFAYQLQYVYDINSAYYPFAFFLLQNLATVKSMSLIADIDDTSAEDIMTTVLEDVVKSDFSSTPQTVRTSTISLLSQMIEAVTVISNTFTEKLLKVTHPTQKARHPAAFGIICEVLNNCKDRLHMNVSQYFCDVIVPSKETLDLEKVNYVHQVIVELYAHVDGVLLSVIPQVEAELKLDNEGIRTLATLALGEMFSQRGSSLSRNYINCWITWMQRKNDKSVAVRLAWLEHGYELLAHHSEQGKEYAEALSQKLLDPEEKVRKATIGVIEKIVKTKDLNLIETLPSALIQELGERCKDKRPLVRYDAIMVLGQLYDSVFHDLVVAATPHLFDTFGWIPSHLASIIRLPERDIYCAVEKAFDEHILPYGEDLKEHARRVLFVYTPADIHQRTLLTEVLLDNQQYTGMFLKYLDICIQLKGHISGAHPRVEEFKKVVRALARLSPEPHQCVEGLSRFAQTNKQDIFTATRTALLNKITRKERHEARGRLMGRVSNLEAGIKRTLERLVARIFPTFVSIDMVPVFIEIALGKVANGSVNELLEAGAREFLTELAKRQPKLFENHLELLSSSLNDSENPALPTLLYALNKLYTKSAEPLQLDMYLKNTLETMCESSVRVVSKYATSILCRARDASVDDLTLLADTRVSHLKKSHQDCLTSLTILTQLLRLNKECVSEDTIESVLDYVKMKLLEKTESSLKDKEDAWLSDKKLPIECFAKIAGIKFIVTYTASVADSLETAPKIFEETSKYLMNILKNDGEISSKQNTPHGFRTRIRLEAAVGLLELVRVRDFEKQFSESEFEHLCVTMQDGCCEVREAFSTKLMKYLNGFKIHARYLVALPLAAYEPETSLRDKVSSFAKRIFTLLKSRNSISAILTKESTPMFLPEDLLGRLIHLIVHHPDFAIKEDEKGSLQVASDFINFYLDMLISPENASFLYQIAIQVKTTRDRLDRSNKDIYVVSDLCQKLIQSRCNQHHWALPSYPGKITLPAHLFSPISDASEANKILKTNFLPAYFDKKKAKTEQQPVPKEQVEVSDDEQSEQEEEKDEIMPKSKRSKRQ